MVAPSPFLNLGVDFGDLLKQIEADLTKLPQKTDLLQLATKDDIAALRTEIESWLQTAGASAAAAPSPPTPTSRGR
jgi:hypothetical protein